MHPRFGLILAALTLGLLTLATLSGPPDATQAAPKPQFPTLTPPLTPPPLPGCWTIDQSLSQELESGRNRMAAPNDSETAGGVHPPVTAPQDVPSYSTFNSVSATGPNDVWAVGGIHSLVTAPRVYHWDGTQWTG